MCSCVPIKGGLPCTKPPGLQTNENRADQLAKTSSVDSIYLVGSAVAKVVVVQSAPGQANTLRRFIVFKQPLQLEGRIQTTTSQLGR